MTSIEFGYKSTLANNSVRFNAAVFTNEYEDIQLLLNECVVPAFIDPDGIGAPCTQPANVGNADIQGVELEAEWFITANLSLDGSFSVLDFEYTELSPVALQRDTPIAPQDMITPYTPETKWALGLQYGHDMGSSGTVNIRIDTSYQDEVFSNATNHPLNRIEDYTLTNLRLWWASPDRDVEIGLEVLNATDELYYHTLFDQSTSVGQVSAGPALPRTWLISAQKRF
jgi:iron complex outermembrane receptor protein